MRYVTWPSACPWDSTSLFATPPGPGNYFYFCDCITIMCAQAIPLPTHLHFIGFVYFPLWET